MISTGFTPSSWAPRMASAWCATRSPANPLSWLKLINTWPLEANIARSWVFPASRTPASGSPNLPPYTSGNTDMQTFDLEEKGLRALHETLRSVGPDSNETAWEVVNAKGSHAIAVGLDA